MVKYMSDTSSSELSEDLQKLFQDYRDRSDVTFLELEAEAPEEVTFGWTDTMIRRVSEENLRSQITQSQRLASSLRQQLNDTETRTSGLKLVLQRKHELNQKR
jgi:hypothetical protein